MTRTHINYFRNYGTHFTELNRTEQTYSKGHYVYLVLFITSGHPDTINQGFSSFKMLCQYSSARIVYIVLLPK